MIRNNKHNGKRVGAPILFTASPPRAAPVQQDTRIPQTHVPDIRLPEVAELAHIESIFDAKGMSIDDAKTVNFLVDKIIATLEPLVPRTV